MDNTTTAPAQPPPHQSSQQQQRSRISNADLVAVLEKLHQELRSQTREASHTHVLTHSITNTHNMEKTDSFTSSFPRLALSLSLSLCVCVCVDHCCSLAGAKAQSSSAMRCCAGPSAASPRPFTSRRPTYGRTSFTDSFRQVKKTHIHTERGREMGGGREGGMGVCHACHVCV